MKSKLFLYLGISLLSLTGFSSFGTVSGANNMVKAATGDEHRMIFKGDYRERNYAESAAGWWGNGYSFNDGVATITTTNAAYFANGATVAGETYVISYDVKTVGSADILFNINTPSWKNIQKEKNKNYTDYVHYDLIYTAEASSDFTVYFAITGTIQVKNLYIHNSSSVTVKEGEVITNLPDIVPVEGKKSYWAIDGKEVKNGDIYNYTSDKVVDLVTEDYPYSITYYNGGALDLASDTKYWNSGTDLTIENNVVHMQNNDGQREIHVYNFSDPLITNLVAGKKYRLTFDIKCDKVALIVAAHNPWTLLFNQEMEYSDFTTKVAEFVPSVNSAISTMQFRIDTIGNVYVKNIRLYEATTVECQKGQAIGTLPEIKMYGKYNEGVWQIDGSDISSETIYNYEDANKIAFVKYSEKYSLVYYGSDDIYTTNLAQNINCWTKQGNVDITKTYNDDALVFTGEKNAMMRYCDPNNFELVENEMYIIKGLIKTGDSKVHMVINNDWTNSVLLVHYQSSDYQEINIKFKAPKNITNDSFIDFQLAVAEGEKQFAIKDFYVLHIKESSYVTGDTLIDLPNAPLGSGWVINDILLTNETIFDFGEDKTAYLAPIISYEGEMNITYRISGKMNIDGLSAQSFYPGDNSYVYTWYDENNQIVSDLVNPGTYKLEIKAVDVNGTKSLNAITLSVNVLEKDNISPDWVRDGNVYVYPNNLNMTVHAGWYAQFNIEALDNVDGIVEVTYNYNGLVDEFNRFVVGSGVVTCVAKDSSGNEIQININLVVVE